MLVTVDWIKKNYDVYNELCFGGVLPKNLSFKVSKSKGTWGYARFKYDYANNTIIPLAITISNYYDSPESVKLNTLIHEMIHIYDYVTNPNHFIFNGRCVGRRYNAHGYWFLNECERLKKYGFDINPKVTNEEIISSTLSASAKLKEAKKSEDCLVFVVKGTIANWMVKTNERNLAKALNSVTKYSWSRYIGLIKTIKIYKFVDARLAKARNSMTQLNGWVYSDERLISRLMEINATEVHCPSMLKPVMKALTAAGKVKVAA